MSTAKHLMACAAFAVGGCAIGGSLPGVTDPQIQDEYHRAMRKLDAHAELQLGIRYEYGQGVPMNWKYAERFYSLASKNLKGEYSSPGGMFTHPTGVFRWGLPEAKQRLLALQAKMRAAGMH